MRWILGILALLLGLLVVASTATADLVPPPVGAPPLRYRDAILPVSVTHGLVYGSAPGASGAPVTLTLDMYRPSGDSQTSRPAIVLVHGGGFYQGNSTGAPMPTIADAFASRGYVAVSINYRLLNQTNEACGIESAPSQNCITAAVAAQQDAQAAVRWLRRYASMYGIDPTRIAIEGASAGAATALEVAVNSGNPGTSGNPGYSSAVEAAISISGALPGGVDRSLYGPSDAPVLMFEGTADTTVPYAAAAQTAADMQSAGMTVAFEALQGGGHVPMATFGDQIVSQSVYFAYDQLNLARAAGQATQSPTATIAQPQSGASYTVGQTVNTQFACQEGWGGPGISSCRDSSGASAPGGNLDTSRAGRRTYTVTAVSADGLSSTAEIAYAVKPRKLTRFSLHPGRLHAATHGPSVVGRGGMKISFRGTVGALVRFVVLRRSGHRWTRIGMFTHHERSVYSTLHFSARLRGHTLKPGAYRLKASAVVQGVQGSAVTAAFRILP